MLARVVKVAGWLGIATAGLVLVGLAVLAARIVLHRQTDDAERLESKRAYLDGIRKDAERTGSGPNLVLIVFDDLGYGDIGVYGSRAIRTPRLDAVAATGATFRHAYSASPYCSGARAGLLTGRYAVRSGLDHVVQAPGTWQDLLLRVGWRNRRLPAEEITLGDVLRAAGYATGLFGKWHLGDESPSLPGDLGFDSFYGLLHSNDQGQPALLEGRTVVEPHPIDQTTLTRRYTDRAVAFIERHRERRFFVYLPHTFPHVPLHASAGAHKRSAAGLYGDVVEELDASVGRIVDALAHAGVAGDTLLVVTSDNGPWFQGSPGGVRGRKFDVFEGGMRVPLIAAWPGRVAPGQVIDEPVIAIDLFPTLLELAGLPPPPDRVIEGRSLAELLGITPERGDQTHPTAILFHQLGVPRAVRVGRFKYHDPHRVPFGNPMDWPWAPTSRRGPYLFDLAADPDESYDVSERHPEVVEDLRAILEQRRRELAENPRGWRQR